MEVKNDCRDVTDRWSNSYTSSYYAKYDCFNEEQEEEENKAQDYSYIDFENALYNHMSQDYSYSSYSPHSALRKSSIEKA